MTKRRLRKFYWPNTDKMSWRSGEWTQEPDKIQWIDKKSELPCVILRHSSRGHLCGYVGISPNHPFYSAGYSSCGYSECEENWCDLAPERVINVRGGLTFSGSSTDLNTEERNAQDGFGISWLNEDGSLMENIQWFGFDCAHGWDVLPGMSRFDFDLGGTKRSYKNIRYLMKECTRLAHQLHNLSSTII